MLNKYLVTGVAASGKTTLESIFHEKGYITADIDKGFAEWRDKTTGRVSDYQPDNATWHQNVIWSLRADKLRQHLESTTDKPVLVFGSTTDLHQYLDLFTKVFILEYPDARTVEKRITKRPGDEYGKSKHELEAVLWYYEKYQSQMKQLGAIAIDCTLPIDEVVKFIENEVRSEAR